MEYNAKIVLITGASAGLGAEFARQFHALGAKVILVARRKERMEALGLEKSAILELDLTNEKDLQELVEYIRSNHIDILVNNAGRGSFGAFEELDLDAEVGQVKLNVIATMRLAHAVMPQLKERRSGAIISVASIASFQPLPFMATYAATKSFNFVHSMALRDELKPFGVRVLTLCPGPTESEFGQVAGTPHNGKLDVEPTAQVISDCINALSADKAFIVPGNRALFISLVSRFLPKAISTMIVGKRMRKAMAETSFK